VTVIDTCSEYLVANFGDMTNDNRNDWLTQESLKVFAVERGILDAFAVGRRQILLKTPPLQHTCQPSLF